MFFLDETLRISRIAGTLAEWLEDEPEAFIGEPITAILAPDDVGAMEAALSRVQTTGTSHSIACRFAVASERIPVEIELAPVAPDAELGAIIGTVHQHGPTDLSVTATSQLLQLQNFIGLLDDAAVVYEIESTEPMVKSVNDAFEETFGYHGQSLVGDSLNDYIVPGDHQNEATRLDEEVAAGNVTTALVKRQTASGLEEFSYRGLPIEGTDEHQYGLAIYGDLTAGQHARQHLQVLHRVLRHNVRNDLTVILGMAEKIATTTPDTEVEQAATRILDRAESLEAVSAKARMAEDILGESPADTIVEVGRTVATVVSDAQSRWPDATIETDIETPLPVSTGLAIQDALENLVENAITHNTESPTVRVTTQTETPIQTTTRASGREVIITIEDDGPGIPANERDVVFEGADMTQLRHSNGLGLWVVRWIVDSANGTLSYERSDGWSVITLRFPRADEFQDGTDSESRQHDTA